MEYTREQLLKRIYDLGYNVETPIIVGVRSTADAPDTFDDSIYLITPSNFYKFTGTTNPGVHWLKSFMNPKGTAVLKPGQYRYKLGLHKGYEALVQAAPVTVYRDSDRDLKSEEAPVTDTGYFGINIHRANQNAISKLISKWSGGCQVLNNPKEFAFLMAEVKKSGKKEILYTLLKQF